MRKLAMLFALCTGATAFSANAATFCVNPAGSGGCSPTVQGGVDAAGPGDTVKIAAGTYREFVVVPAAKDGLILQGGSAKKTIIDPNGTGNEGLDISSNDVQVIGIGVNNSDTDGILVNGTGFIMKKSQVQNAQDNCVQMTVGTDALFQGNRFFGCDDDAVLVTTGTGLEFIGNRMTSAGDDGLDVDAGDNVLAEKNVCENMDGDCIEVSGNDTVAEKNVATITDDETVSVTGNGAQITGNRAIGGGGSVDVTGENPLVSKNTSTAAVDSPVVDVQCTADCTGALVEKNRVSQTDGVQCFDLTFDTDGGSVVKNVAQKCRGDGFTVAGSGAVSLEGNTASKTGSAFDDGFEISGMGVKTLTKNKASNSGGNGFFVFDAADHVLTENQSKNNAQNGFLLDASSNGVTMTGNQATGNGEEGIDNQGDDNVFTDNKAKGNSEGQDFCDSAANATGTVDNGNDFESTATVCLNE